jgi:uncharacterized OB-fold protein
MSTEYTLAPPAPRLTDWNRPYFEAAADGQFALQHCDSCGKTNYYPRVACSGCLSTQLTWKPITAAGTVYSFSVVWRPKNAAFDPHLPIVMVAVQLDDGPLVITNLVDCDHEDVEIGMRVEGCFSALDGGPVLPRFRPAEA